MAKRKIVWTLVLLGGAALLILVVVLAGRTRTPSPAPSTKEPSPAAAAPARFETEPQSEAEPQKAEDELPLPPPVGASSEANKPEKPPRPLPASGPSVALAPRDHAAPAIEVLEPADRSYTLASRLQVRAVSEAGAEVTANGQKLTESEPGRFDGQLELAVGANKLMFEARDSAGNKNRAMVLVTYIDPEGVAVSRERLRELISQLEEIRAAENEAERQIGDILQRMKATAKSEELEKLDAELRDVRQSRRQLREEIEKEMGELDGLLRSAGGGRGAEQGIEPAK